ncbi:MAG: alpha-amylase family protein [bacterium]
MIRGLHYMCWYRQDWNYHPSMPMKRLQQVQDIVDMNGNLLLWSCLGSAAIGIQYLDKEAKETIPPRLRFYGYLNDKEFIAECAKRGITACAVIWKAQLWEFPAEFSEDESELLALNKLRGVGKKGWIGMRELSTDRYPKIFPSIKKFFPKGLKDSDGKPVKDFLAGFMAVTLDGNPIFSKWLMVPGHDHYCYSPCGNKPAFREYVRKEIEIMIDAGAPVVHIDEFDAQLLAAMSGGCFCKDCLKLFREYLKKNPSAETAGFDLDRFDYRAFLKKKGYTDKDLTDPDIDKRLAIPLWPSFVRFHIACIEPGVIDIADHVRAYSRKKTGKAAQVTANLYNCDPHGEAVRKHCDLIIGEKADIKLRQDGYYRYGFAFFGGKEGSSIEDPGPYVHEIMRDIDSGKNDSYILFMLEPLAHGFNIAIPYGGWLQNQRQDSFYPPAEAERRMGVWMKEHETFFTNRFVAETAVLYDQRSALDCELTKGLNRRHLDVGFPLFHGLCQSLCDARMLYNVLYVSPDEPLTAKRLAAYKQIVLPDAYSLSDSEIRVIRAWQKKGGRLVGIGKVDPRLADTEFRYGEFQELKAHLAQAGSVVVAQDVEGLGLSLHKRGKGYALHMVNYRLNSGTREIEKIPRASFDLGWKPKKATVHSFPASHAKARLEGNTLTVENLGIYTVVELG